VTRSGALCSACALLLLLALVGRGADGGSASLTAGGRAAGESGVTEARAALAPGAAPAYWVFLDPAAAASTLPVAVGAEALAQRGEFATDRPVNPALVARVESAGGRVRTVSRWLRAVSVEADAAALARIAALPGVVAITPVRVGTAAGAETLPGATAGIAATGFASSPAAAAITPWAARRDYPSARQDSAAYGATWTALRELNIPVLHSLGFRGEGRRIAILDTGFLLGHEVFAGRSVMAQRNFITGTTQVGWLPGDPLHQTQHGTAVWSLLGGYREGRLIGGAPNASFYLAKVKRVDGDLRADEDRWVAAVEWADSLGVHLINSSIGFRDDFLDRPQIPYGDLDGNTTITTRMADEAARRGILVVVAIGNSGPQSGTLWAPADADSVISVGAIAGLTATRAAIPTDISSRGPTADGRTKPELSARGAGLVAASALGPTEYQAGLTGSSFATPFVTAGAALFAQAWPNLSIMAVRNALMLAGSDALRPNNVTGYGVPDVAAAVMMPDGIVLTQTSLGNVDLQGNLTTVLPTFRWETPLIHSQMRPILYTVQVARDSLFTDIIYADTVREANQLTARQPLHPVERAFWRVVATSPLGVRRVSPARPPFRVPGWVRLLTLNDAEPVFIEDARPELSWAPLAAPAPVGPFTYDVQVISVATGEIVQQVRNLTTSSVRVPEALTANTAYRWRVIARTQTGVTNTVESTAPFVIVSSEAPPATILYQNFPNPFGTVSGGSVTRIWFDLHQDTPVELNVYDLRGRLIRRLIPARDCGVVTLPAGLYGRTGQTINAAVGTGCVLTSWDGRDERGERVSRGVYVLRLRAAGVSDVRRILYLPE
jgi:hypothetical protein